MLNNVKSGTRVKLAGGKMATVVDPTVLSIRPDGGTLRTRRYRMDGTVIDGDSSLNVAEVLASGNGAALEAAIQAVVTLAQTPAGVDVDGSEPITENGIELRRHRNPEGDFGGYVASTAKVDPSARISRGSRVLDTAVVEAGGHLKNKSIARGTARVVGVLDGVDFDGRTVRPVA